MAMASQNIPQMSLLAEYDDLCRFRKVLTASCEEQFKTFVEGHLIFVRKCKQTELMLREEISSLKSENGCLETESQKLHQKISRLESEKGRLETQIKFLKNVHLDAENRRRNVEREKNSLERRMDLIIELLSTDGVMDNETKEKLGILSSCKQSSISPSQNLDTIEESTGSLLSLSDDATQEELLSEKSMFSCNARQSKGKRNCSENTFVQRKKKVEGFDQELTNDENDTNESATSKTMKRLSVRCNSEPSSTSPESKVKPRSVLKSDSVQCTNIPNELRKSTSAPMSVSTPNARYSTGGKLSRQHDFISKVLYRPERCNPCRINIGFFNQAFKCQDCALICHPECRDKCPLPCIPIVHTPTEKATGTIADYTSSTAPMIPPLIVYCVQEIEKRGLKEKGLYRVSGGDREVKLLKDKFLNSRSIPFLHRHDTNAICSAIKEFLRSLNEPLITRRAWQEFVNVSDLEDVNKSVKAIYDVVCSLPQPNRDTLAYLVLHLQKVAESPECKMPIPSLAKIFGPTVIGYSVAEPSQMTVLKETKDQHKVMERLLCISSESWDSLLNVEPEVFANGWKKTPEQLPAPKINRLGPLVPHGHGVRAVLSHRTPLSSRDSRLNKSGKLSFKSPLAK